MPEAPKSSNEAKRLEAIEKLKIIGTPAEERFDKITRMARQLFNVPMSAITIIGDQLAWLKSVQGFDAIEGLRKDSYCQYTVLDSGICLVTDARIDPRVCDNINANNWVFYAGAPLYFEQQRVGALCIGDHEPRMFNAEQRQTLLDLALLAEEQLKMNALSQSQIALAKSNEELMKRVNIDHLTHLWNRGAILDITQTELTHACDQTMIALLMIDIDNYKQINDTYGHVIGDEILRVFAERLRKAIRPKDAVGRYGGDEFLAVLADVQISDVLKIGERICKDISTAPVIVGDKVIQITCSVGCTTTYGVDSINAVICRADTALYRAKSAGKNCLELN